VALLLVVQEAEVLIAADDVARGVPTQVLGMRRTLKQLWFGWLEAGMVGRITVGE